MAPRRRQPVPAARAQRPISNKIPLAIIDQHVDAVRAIVREHGRADIGAIAAALTGKLRAVTDEFLVARTRTGRRCSRTIQSPSIIRANTRRRRQLQSRKLDDASGCASA